MPYPQSLQAALAEIDRHNRRWRVVHMLRARASRRKLVNEFSRRNGYRSLMGWLAEPLPLVKRERLLGGFMSTDEAVAWLRKEFARIRRMKEIRGADYYAYRDNAHRIPGLRDRLIVARYFARFGQSIWLREAA